MRKSSQISLAFYQGSHQISVKILQNRCNIVVRKSSRNLNTGIWAKHGPSKKQEKTTKLMRERGKKKVRTCSKHTEKDGVTIIMLVVRVFNHSYDSLGLESVVRDYFTRCKITIWNLSASVAKQNWSHCIYLSKNTGRKKVELSNYARDTKLKRMKSLYLVIKWTNYEQRLY